MANSWRQLCLSGFQNRQRPGGQQSIRVGSRVRTSHLATFVWLPQLHRSLCHILDQGTALWHWALERQTCGNAQRRILSVRLWNGLTRAAEAKFATYFWYLLKWLCKYSYTIDQQAAFILITKLSKRKPAAFFRAVTLKVDWPERLMCIESDIVWNN